MPSDFRVSKPTKILDSSRQLINYTPDCLSEKKYAYLTLKTSQKERDLILSNRKLENSPSENRANFFKSDP
jgi:hypothetical protein